MPDGGHEDNSRPPSHPNVFTIEPANDQRAAAWSGTSSPWRKMDEETFATDVRGRNRSTCTRVQFPNIEEIPRRLYFGRVACGHYDHWHLDRAVVAGGTGGAQRPPRRLQCHNNLKQLALACHNCRPTAMGEFPTGGIHIWDAYTLVGDDLPYIEQQAVYDGYYTLTQTEVYAGAFPPGTVSPLGIAGDDSRMCTSRTTILPGYCCPSDIAPVPNQLATPQWGYYRSSYRGCAGSGDACMAMPSSMKPPGPRGSTSVSSVSRPDRSDAPAAGVGRHLCRHFGRYVVNRIAFREPGAGP